jgi:uncharacterized protein YutE (UPF0331/DUF86 family)
MDRVLIAEKLEALRYCIARVAERCPSELVKLEGSADLQDIVVLNLTRSIQLCVDIASHIIAASDEAAPTTMSEALNKLAQLRIIDARLANELTKAVGFSNIAVHNYEQVDWKIVHEICNTRLDDFRQYASAISKLVDG